MAIGSELFSNLARTSIYVCPVILIVILLRAILWKAPKRMTCFLWGIAAMRLILPAFPKIGISIIPQFVADRLSNSGASFAAENIDAAEGSQIYAWDFRGFLVIIWLTGMLGMILYTLIRAVRLHRTLRQCEKAEENVFFCDKIASPFVFGLLRPHIYLPADIDQKDLEYVMTHEKAHISRRDHWWKTISWILVCIYWFHPLVWLAFILFGKDLEMACDETVISSSDARFKRAYSEALLNCQLSSVRIGLYRPLAFGEVDVEKRICRIARLRKQSKLTLILLSLFLILFAVICLSDPLQVQSSENRTDNSVKEISGKDASDQSVDDPQSSRVRMNKKEDRKTIATAADPALYTEHTVIIYAENTGNAKENDPIARPKRMNKIGR